MLLLRLAVLFAVACIHMGRVQSAEDWELGHPPKLREVSNVYSKYAELESIVLNITRVIDANS